MVRSRCMSSSGRGRQVSTPSARCFRTSRSWASRRSLRCRSGSRPPRRWWESTATSTLPIPAARRGVMLRDGIVDSPPSADRSSVGVSDEGTIDIRRVAVVRDVARSRPTAHAHRPQPGAGSERHLAVHAQLRPQDAGSGRRDRDGHPAVPAGDGQHRPRRTLSFNSRASAARPSPATGPCSSPVVRRLSGSRRKRRSDPSSPSG